MFLDGFQGDSSGSIGVFGGFGAVLGGVFCVFSGAFHGVKPPKSRPSARFLGRTSQPMVEEI